MLQPKRTKFRRPQRLSYEGLAKGGTNVEFGEFGLQALEGSYITNPSNRKRTYRVSWTYQTGW